MATAVAMGGFSRHAVTGMLTNAFDMAEENLRIREEEKRKIKEEKAKAKQEERDARDFEKIRKKLLKSALSELGITEKEYSAYLDFYNKNKGQSETTSDVLSNAFGTFSAQSAAIKGNRRDLLVSTLSVSLTIFLQVMAATAASASFLATLSYAPLALTIMVLVDKFKRFKKGEKNNLGDLAEKNKHLLELLEKFIPVFNAFQNSINSDKQKLLEKKRTMKKAEFAEFLQEYTKQKIKEFGLQEIFTAEEATAVVSNTGVEKEETEVEENVEEQDQEVEEEQSGSQDNKENDQVTPEQQNVVQEQNENYERGE